MTKRYYLTCVAFFILCSTVLQPACAVHSPVHAKTGTIAYLRSLSGYVRTADGEMLAFAMIANNFLVSNKSVEYAQDSAVERLAAFTRQ